MMISIFTQKQGLYSFISKVHQYYVPSSVCQNLTFFIRSDKSSVIINNVEREVS